MAWREHYGWGEEVFRLIFHLYGSYPPVKELLFVTRFDLFDIFNLKIKFTAFLPERCFIQEQQME